MHVLSQVGHHAGVHASCALRRAMPAGFTLDTCVGGCVSVGGHLPDMHEPAVSCLGAHEEIGAARCCRPPPGTADAVMVRSMLMRIAKQGRRQMTAFEPALQDWAQVNERKLLAIVYCQI